MDSNTMFKMRRAFPIFCPYSPTIPFKDHVLTSHISYKLSTIPTIHTARFYIFI